MHSSYGKKHATSGMFYNRCKTIRMVNTGNLLVPGPYTVYDKSRLVPVYTSILHLQVEYEVTIEEVTTVTLRIGHNLPFWSTWISAAIDSCHADTSGDFRAWL